MTSHDNSASVCSYCHHWGVCFVDIGASLIEAQANENFYGSSAGLIHKMHIIMSSSFQSQSLVKWSMLNYISWQLN